MATRQPPQAAKPAARAESTSAGPAGEPSAPAEKDEVFRAPLKRASDFEFSSDVVQVFDDMVDRSVPFYAEIQRMIVEMALDFAEPNARVYDLGCATGTTLAALAKEASMPLHLIGFDNAQEMLDRAEQKLSRYEQHRVDLRPVDLNEDVQIADANVVFMILTLQFVRPLYREHILRRVYEGLNDNGCLILVEKVLGEHSLFNRLFIRYYYDMKRRAGYSELEISQKREALENVLVPYRLEENKALLERVGFRQCDSFFKWYNFSGMIAVK